jgi:hypothetical protein
MIDVRRAHRNRALSQRCRTSQGGEKGAGADAFLSKDAAAEQLYDAIVALTH